MAGKAGKNCYAVRGCDPAVCRAAGEKCAAVAVKKNCWSVGKCGVIGCNGFCAGCWIYLTARGVVSAVRQKEQAGSS